MLPHAMLAALFIFGSRNRNDPKGLLERTGHGVERSGSERGIAEQGGACAIFQRRAPELCMMNSRDEKIDLCILMANCQLETIGSPPLKYGNTKDMAKAPEADKIIVMQMLSKLPVFCTSLATYGLNINFMHMEHTITLVNNTNEKLEEIIRISAEFEQENRKGVAVQQRLLEVSEQSLQQSKSISESSEKMQHELANFTQDVSAIFTAFTDIEKNIKAAIKKDNETLQQVKHFAERTREMIRSIDLTSRASRETRLSVEVMQYRLVLVLIMAWYVVPRASVGIFTVVAFILCFSLVTALWSMQYGGGLVAVFRSARRVTKAFNFLTGRNLDLNHMAAGLVTLVLLCVSRFAFPHVTSMLRKNRHAGEDRPQSINEAFDVHNIRDILALLQVQKRHIVKQKRMFEHLLQITQAAIDISMKRQPANFGTPIRPAPAFVRRTWERSPVARRFAVDKKRSARTNVSTPRRKSLRSVSGSSPPPHPVQ